MPRTQVARREQFGVYVTVTLPLPRCTPERNFVPDGARLLPPAPPAAAPKRRTTRTAAGPGRNRSCTR